MHLTRVRYALGSLSNHTLAMSAARLMVDIRLHLPPANLMESCC